MSRCSRCRVLFTYLSADSRLRYLHFGAIMNNDTASMAVQGALQDFLNFSFENRARNRIAGKSIFNLYRYHCTIFHSVQHARLSNFSTCPTRLLSFPPPPPPLLLPSSSSPLYRDLNPGPQTRQLLYHWVIFPF